MSPLFFHGVALALTFGVSVGKVAPLGPTRQRVSIDSQGGIFRERANAL